MEDLMKQILSKLDNLDNRIVTIDNKIDTLDNRIDALDNKIDTLDNRIDTLQQGQSRIEKKLDAVYDQTADLTEFRTSTTDNLSEIRKDVNFIKHKLHQNEEEIFDIKSHIKIVK